jgi:hypothetical protein
VISNTEREEFFEDQQEQDEDDEQLHYMDYDPNYLFPPDSNHSNYPLQRRSLDTLPYRDHIYSTSFDTMKGRPRSASSLPSAYSEGSVRSAKSALSKYEGLAAMSSREAQILFVEGRYSFFLGNM